MRFEELIKEYETLKFKIRRTIIKEQEIRELEGFSISAREDGMPKSKQNSSTVEKSALKLAEIFEERKSLEQKLLTAREQLSRSIDYVSSFITQEVLETKIFVPNCGWKYVSQKIGLSESHCRHLYREGVQEIDEKLGEKLYEI